MRALPLALAAALAVAAPLGVAFDPPQPVPDVVAGFALAPFAVLQGPGALSAIAFGPGGADGPDLYGTDFLTGKVVRWDVAWTAAGPVAGVMATFAGGFEGPLGLVFDGQGVLYVADSHEGAESGRTDGRVWRVEGSERDAVVDGLPNGRHNTNNLRFGPDGRLYLANGNANDDGASGGPADVFPYSGAILSVDAAEVAASPAVLHWKDDQGNAIPPGQIAAHPRNADFAAKVRVLASGFRNVYDVAFGPTGVAYTGMNGADDAPSQDALYRIAPGTDYGFPFCYNVGEPGGTQVGVVNNPAFPAADCSRVTPADALLGWHSCATGLDLPTAGPWGFTGGFARSVYVAECGAFFVGPGDGVSTYNYGHRVARAELDAQGGVVALHDFITGLALPTDVHFGLDGAMYVADVAAVHRVAQLVELP